jgi:membrane-bound lytic murein transglycosylase
MKTQLFKKYVLALMFVIGSSLLTGCLSPEQIRANNLRAQQQAQAERQMQMNAISNQCDGYGFKKGTPDFARCVQQESNRNDSCNASKAAIQQRVRQCQSQCYQSLNVMECNNRCQQAYGTPPNC